MVDIIKHYDLLVDEGNDPFRDPPALQEYMNRWDGQAFLDYMQLDKTKSVLEIVVGTGRLAVRVAPRTADFSEDTHRRAGSKRTSRRRHGTERAAHPSVYPKRYTSHDRDRQPTVYRTAKL